MEGRTRSISIGIAATGCHDLELLLGWLVLAWTPVLVRDYCRLSSFFMHHIVSAASSGFADHSKCIGSAEFH